MRESCAWDPIGCHDLSASAFTVTITAVSKPGMARKAPYCLCHSLVFCPGEKCLYLCREHENTSTFTSWVYRSCYTFLWMLSEVLSLFSLPSFCKTAWTFLIEIKMLSSSLQPSPFLLSRSVTFLCFEPQIPAFSLQLYPLSHGGVRGSKPV